MKTPHQSTSRTKRGMQMVGIFLLLTSLSLILSLRRDDKVSSTTAATTIAKMSTVGGNSTTANHAAMDNSDYWVSVMKYHGLHESVKQQAKFQQRLSKPMPERFLLEDKDQWQLLYPFFARESSAIILNSKFTYRHIWKNGGTAIQKYMGNADQHYLEEPEIKASDNIWMTLVRDPISHLLSGWSEVGVREIEERMKERNITFSSFRNEQEEHDVLSSIILNDHRIQPKKGLFSRSRNGRYHEVTSITDLNGRIYNYLQFMLQMIRDGHSSDMGHAVHSVPQINFLLVYDKRHKALPASLKPIKPSSNVNGGSSKGFFYPNLQIVGDLSEMFGILYNVMNITIAQKKLNEARRRHKIPSKEYHEKMMRNGNATYIFQLLKKDANSLGARRSEDDPVKMKYYPSSPQVVLPQLSDATIQAICKFVKLDYYFLDYEPPKTCKDNMVL